MSNTKAITLPLSDPANDVVLIQNGVTITNVVQTSVDISELDVDESSSQITFSFYGNPVIDNLHKYNVTIFWDATGVNRTDCLAGNIGTEFYNGTKTVLKNSIGTVVYSDEFNDTAILNVTEIIFPIVFPNLTLARNMGSAFDAGGIATVPAETTDGTSAVPSEDYTYVDACGMFPAWIPIPDEGGIELPIIVTLLGTSFIIILVIRKRKKIT